MCPVSYSGQWQMIRKQLEEWKIHSFSIGIPCPLLAKKPVHLRLLCLIAPDWSVSINLMSPFLNEFIILIFEVDTAVEFPAQLCIVRRHFHWCHCSFPQSNWDWASPFNSVWWQHVRATTQQKRVQIPLLAFFLFSSNCTLCQSCLQFRLHIFCGFPLLSTGSLVNLPPRAVQTILLQYLNKSLAIDS